MNKEQFKHDPLRSDSCKKYLIAPFHELPLMLHEHKAPGRPEQLR